MKKILIPFLLLAALLTFIKIGFALSGSVTTPNVKQLLADGDMEATNAAVNFTDGNMEAAGTGAWYPSQATLSKETVTPHTGLQSLRVTYNGFTDGAAYIGGITGGRVYHITGWARGDGGSSPLVSSAWMTPTYFAGTTDNSWQAFDVTVIASTDILQFGSHNLSSGHYVEFDDISVTDVTAGSYPAIAATVSKQTTNPHGGKQVLRVTADGTQVYGDSYQNILTTGKRYRITGWARAGGSAAYPSIFFGGNNQVWSGSVSTAWQRFDVTSSPIGGGQLFLIAFGVTGAGQYVEFDDVMVTEATGYTQVQDTQTLVDGDMEGKPVALVNGNFEGAAGPPPAGWTELSIAATRVAGARTGGIGSYVAQIGYNGSSAGYLYQYSPLSNGNTYRVTGWARSVDGIAVPGVSDSSAAGLRWTGTNSTTWQYFDYTGVSQSTGFMMAASSLGVGGAVQFDDFSIIDTGATAWSAVQSVLSKQTTSPHGGNQVIRIAYDNANADGYAIQAILTIGKKYRMTGWMRGDGTSYPQIYLGGGGAVAIGTASTAWQRFDVVKVADLNTLIDLASVNLSAGHYVEFDDVTVTEDKGKQQVINKQVVVEGDMEGLPIAVADAAMEAADTSAWTVNVAGTFAKDATTVRPGSSGTKSLKITYTVNNFASLYQNVLVSGHTYHIQGWFKSDGSETAIVYTNSGVAASTASASWTPFDAVFLASGVGFQLQIGSAHGSAWFDDISVVDIGTSAWTPGSSNATLTKSTASPHSGKYALRAAWGSGTYVYASGGDIFTPGKKYRMTGWVRSDGAAIPTINMSGGQNIWTGTADTSWQKIDVTFTPLYGALYLLYYANSAAWVEWDDLYATLAE